MRENTIPNQLEDRLFESLADGISEGVYYVTADHVVVFWNKRAELLSGYSQFEVTGMACSNKIVHTADETKCDEGGPTFGVIFFDIDDFKKINDVGGHEIGALVLRHTVQVVETALRPVDFLFRWGGEEYRLGPPNDIGSRRRDWRTHQTDDRGDPARVGDQKLAYTVSVGVSLHKKDQRAVDTIAKADKLMYSVKTRGTESWSRSNRIHHGAEPFWKNCRRYRRNAGA